MMEKIRHPTGFTLVELLVVLAIVSILSVIFVEVFFRNLRGGSKTQITGVLKQNGQAALETMDKIIRSSDKVKCPLANSQLDTLVLQKGSQYIRFKFNPPTSSPPANGFISQDSVGDCTSPLLNATSLTNTNVTNGASVLSGSFSLNSHPGYKDLVTVNFQIGPAVNIPKTLTDTTEPIRFNTTVELR